MKIKSAFVAAALAVAAIGTAQANTTKTIGVIDSNGTFEQFSTGPGYFFDTLNFEVGGASVVTGSATNFLTKLKGIVTKDISNLSVKVWNNFHDDGTTTYGTFAGDGNDFVVNFPAAGKYHLDITGYATGSKGGFYEVALAAAPVPEPESYALFLAGLGLMGTIARRRSQKETV